ncbi:MAG: molybdopterin-guanine dinucleotide biosynthesis protein B [Methanobacteriota archaeon]|nr:MAG: molybdopterin-guanine dinucleotide biosynthesis protein B [Euryarchaeota archaeon]
MILNIYGRSKSGKTTLIEKIVRRLTEEGHSVVTVKHIKKEGFTIDTEGKDTWRHAEAGAQLLVAGGDQETSFMLKRTVPLEKIIDAIQKNIDTDVILVEGYKSSTYPKVAVGDIEEGENTVFRLKENEDDIVEYIKSKIEFERVYNHLPLLDCEDCGFDCATFAERVMSKDAKTEDCKHYGRKSICVTVDGKKIPLKKFPAEIFGNAVLAMLNSLRGVGDFDSATIEVQSPAKGGV